jgi:hypothetical protein
MDAIPQVDLVLPAIPAGILGPHCQGTRFKTSWQVFTNGTRHARLTCAVCGRFERYLKQHPEQPDFRYQKCNPEIKGAARRPPPASWHWLAHIRHADGKWYPVAMAETLARCWDALLTYPYEGDRLAFPVEPLQRKGVAG